jgi:hypothetical protein
MRMQKQCHEPAVGTGTDLLAVARVFQACLEQPCIALQELLFRACREFMKQVATTLLLCKQLPLNHFPGHSDSNCNADVRCSRAKVSKCTAEVPKHVFVPARLSVVVFVTNL